jgi:hypothetical protein
MAKRVLERSRCPWQKVRSAQLPADYRWSPGRQLFTSAMMRKDGTPSQPERSHKSRRPIHLHTLSYLVLDDGRLVAAFMSRDDAEQWIEEAGHPAMELRVASKSG